MMVGSGFGYVPSVVQIKKRGLFAPTVINKKAHWPKHTEAQEVIDEMKGQDVGTIRAQEGNSAADNEQVIWLKYNIYYTPPSR